MQHSLGFSKLSFAMLGIRDKMGLGTQLIGVCPIQTCWAQQQAELTTLGAAGCGMS